MPATFGTPAGTTLSVFLAHLDSFYPEALQNSDSSHSLISKLNQLRLMENQENALSQTILEAVDAHTDQLRALQDEVISRARDACRREGRTIPEVLILPEDVSESEGGTIARGSVQYDLEGRAVVSVDRELGTLAALEKDGGVVDAGDAGKGVGDVVMGEEGNGGEV
jgi:hypothetical protein